jgi:transposase
MTTDHLFTQALGLSAPWKVVSSSFDPAASTLELVIDFEAGSRFPDPDASDAATEDSTQAAALCPVHDTVQRCWQHLSFFQHRTTIRARVPRIKTPAGKVKTAAVPWAKPNSGFTLLMEAFLLTMAKVLPVTEISKQTKVSQDRIWHLVRSRVDEAWKQSDWKSLKRLGVDETSTRKGHKYGTAFLEIDGQETARGQGASKVSRLLFFTPGKGKEARRPLLSSQRSWKAAASSPSKWRKLPWICRRLSSPQRASIFPKQASVSIVSTS